MRAAAVVLGVMLLSVSVFAGEYLMNEETAMGLRVVFSEPVTITGFGDIFTVVSPEGEASEFLFYGGELAPWDGHWLNWEPRSAMLLRSEWLSEEPGTLDEDASQRQVEITGTLLNLTYFAHPAYVMPGESDRDGIFAMPLSGIPELDFYPVRTGVSPDAASWSVEVDDPESVDAAIEDDVLYIWASADRGVGVSAVRLTATLPSGEEGQAAIPVTVFRNDKTLAWVSGRKDYFVPWSPEIDINRIRSVRTHAETYGFEDLSRLDTTVRFSRWRPMPRLYDVEESLTWQNELTPGGFWTKSAQLRLTTVLLEEFAAMGARTVRLATSMYTEGRSGTEIFPVYDGRAVVGPSMRPDEHAYFVNEAHRMGLMVLTSTQLWGLPDSVHGRSFENFEFVPADRDEFWSNYRQLTRDETLERFDLGVDVLSVGLNVHLIDSQSGHGEETDQQVCRMIEEAREIYPGPITCIGGSLWYQLGGKWNADFRLWELVDILATGVIHTLRPLTEKEDPTLDELVAEWEWRIDEYFEPFARRYNKPLIAHENGCFSAEGSLPWGMFAGLMPGVNIQDADVSMIDQELHFESFIKAFEDEDWFYGPGFCCVDFAPYESIGGINDRTWSFREKPAQQIISDYLRSTTPRARNKQDGSTEDWPESALRIDDPRGDQSGSDDILSIAAYQDASHIHLAVEYSSPPRGNLIIKLDVSGDGNVDYVLAPIPPASAMEMYVNPILDDDSDEWIGIVDVAVADRTVELRVDKAFLPLCCQTILFWVVDHKDGWAGTEDSVPGPHEIPFIAPE